MNNSENQGRSDSSQANDGGPTRKGGSGKRVILQLSTGNAPIGYFGLDGRGYGIVVNSDNDAEIFGVSDQGDGAVYSATYRGEPHWLNHDRRGAGVFEDSTIWEQVAGTGFVDTSDETVLSLDGSSIIVEKVARPTDSVKALSVKLIQV